MGLVPRRASLTRSRWEWLADLGTDATILDYGCGYGRSVVELHAHGYRDVTGVDPSVALIHRARELAPNLQFWVITDPPKIPEHVSRVDLTLISAVLTCDPADADQAALIDGVWQATAPGGFVYISDLLIDEADSARYRTLAGSDHPYGTFETEAGGGPQISIIRPRAVPATTQFRVSRPRSSSVS